MRKKYIRTKAAACAIQKFYRKTRMGRIYRKEFLRKRNATTTLQRHFRRWLTSFSAPAFQMVPPDEKAIDPETGDLKSVNTYRIDPETGEMEMVPIGLEDYVARLNAFLDFKSLSKMSAKSWKKSNLKKAEQERLQRQLPQLKIIVADCDEEDNENEVCEEVVGNNFKVSIKPSKELGVNGEQTAEVKFNQYKNEKQAFCGILTETSHWKNPFESRNYRNDNFVDYNTDEVDEDFDENPESLDFISSATSNNLFDIKCESTNVVESVLDLIIENIAPPSFQGNQFNNWRKHENQAEKSSWLERNIEAKRDSVKINAAVTIQSFWRSFHHKKRFNKNKKAALMIQKWFRQVQNGRQTRQQFCDQKQAALIIQSYWRGMVARRKFEKQKMEADTEKAVLTLQCRWRGMVARKNFEKLKMTNSVLNELIDGAVAPRNAAQDIIDRIIIGMFPPIEQKTNEENSNYLLEEFLRRFPDKDPKKKRKNGKTGVKRSYEGENKLVKLVESNIKKSVDKSNMVEDKTEKNSQLEEFLRRFPEKDPKNRRKITGVQEESKKNVQHFAKRSRKVTTNENVNLKRDPLEETNEKKPVEDVSITRVTKKAKVETNPSEDIFILEEKIIKPPNVKKICNKVGCKGGVKRPIKDFIDIADSGDEDDDSEVLIVDSHDPPKKISKIETTSPPKKQIKAEMPREDPLKNTAQKIVMNDEDLDNLYGESFVTSKPIIKPGAPPVKKDDSLSDVKTESISITKVPLSGRRGRSKTGFVKPAPSTGFMRPPPPPMEDDFEPPQVSVRRTRSKIVSGIVKPQLYK